MPKKRILILDDEKSLLDILARELRAEGYIVATMESKLRALDLMMEWRPDMILSDIRSPAMDGWELLRWVRANPWADRVSFIFITGDSRHDNAIRSRQLGANDFISKPYDLEELLSIIRREFTTQGGPAVEAPPSFGEHIGQDTLFCLPWRNIARRWQSALRHSPYRTAVLTMSDRILDFVVDDGSSLILGRLVRPIDPGARYSAEGFHCLLDHYGVEKGIFYILTPHAEHDAISSRAIITTAAETAEVFSAGVYAPDLNRFET